MEEREDELRSLRDEVDELTAKLASADESRRKERAKTAELEAKMEETKRQLEDKQNGGLSDRRQPIRFPLTLTCFHSSHRMAP